MDPRIRYWVGVLIGLLMGFAISAIVLVLAVINHAP